MTKKWMPFDDECAHCGSDAVEVFTDSGSDNVAFDGDAAKCTECVLQGQVCVIEDDEDASIGEISWHDEPDCEPCVKQGASS